MYKRLQIVLFRLVDKSCKEIIELLDCNQTRIWRNLKKYEELGLDSLLQERRGGRNHAYMTVEEESVNWDLVRLLKEYVLISIVITYVNSLVVTDLTGESFFLIVG